MIIQTFGFTEEHSSKAALQLTVEFKNGLKWEPYNDVTTIVDVNGGKWLANIKNP